MKVFDIVVLFQQENNTNEKDSTRLQLAPKQALKIVYCICMSDEIYVRT